MTFDDFKKNFHRVEICNLSPDELGEEAKQAKRRWEVSVKEGMWKKNVNAGGCINNRGLFYLSSVSCLLSPATCHLHHPPISHLFAVISLIDLRHSHKHLLLMSFSENSFNNW
jgi:hypothetical protein